MNILTQECPHKPLTTQFVIKINSNYENHYNTCDDCYEDFEELADKIVPLAGITN